MKYLISAVAVLILAAPLYAGDLTKSEKEVLETLFAKTGTSQESDSLQIERFFSEALSSNKFEFHKINKNSRKIISKGE